MNSIAKLSVVIPVRDGQQRIASEVSRVLEAVADLTSAAIEIVVVDDGSQDATAEVMEDLRRQYPQVRVARHRRPLGMEAAGQTGLERATGELVFIKEDDQPLRIEDLIQLYRMGADPSVVAARAQSESRESNAPLLRRLRAWGARAVDALKEEADGAAMDQPIHGLQMVRRPHLQLLASRGAGNLQLTTERIRSAAVNQMALCDSPTGDGDQRFAGSVAQPVVDRDQWCAETMGV